MVQLKKTDPAQAPKPISKPSETLSARNQVSKPADSSHSTDASGLPQPRFDSL
jgi:hypothetical protein